MRREKDRAESMLSFLFIPVPEVIENGTDMRSGSATFVTIGRLLTDSQVLPKLLAGSLFSFLI